MKTIGIIGSGMVSQALADGLLRHGYGVMRGSRDASKLSDWQKSAGPNARIGSFAETAKFGEIVILAVKGTAAESAISACGDALNGKTVIDTTNPIADAPPVNGVLRFFTDLNQSLMEQLQSKFPTVNFVKAFSCVGNAFMIDPDFGATRPTMFICGNDNAAKAAVSSLLAEVRWDVADMGSVEAARAIEPLCMLWCIPGLRGGSWAHAFALLRK
ncbi:MAG TPA: NAD(P)-binding domain-containing protein [Polyangiaceae bacterium]|jgi:hypothetical protein|nr:NAD(P)-binding domain-containing protein [Polyangiaceae bacterium]